MPIVRRACAAIAALLTAGVAAACMLDVQGAAAPCPAGQSHCGGVCRDLSADAENCGRCEHACGPGVACTEGFCEGEAPCLGGLTRCGDACIDLQGHPFHCGACDAPCAQGKACVDGVCAEDPCEDPATATTACLVERNLVVRYFLDEASAEDPLPTRARDSAPDPEPMHLAITSGETLSYIEESGHRGLSWSEAGRDARASIPVDDTKLKFALQDARRATLEVVVDIEQADSGRSRIIHIGEGVESGRLTLSTPTTSELRAYLNGEKLVGRWPLDLPGRKVLHLVLDTTLPEAERVRLYVDGQPAQPLNEGTPPVENEAINLGANRHLVLGNREIGLRSFQGQLFYAAIYAAALDAEQIARNAAILAADDDGPAAR